MVRKDLVELVQQKSKELNCSEKWVIPVLGAGISGLLSAKAISQYGYCPIIIDRDISFKPDRFPGLHYLHDRCGLDLKPMYLENSILRDPQSKKFPHEDYAEKLGTTEDNSVKRLTCYSAIYDIKEAYKLLYEKFKNHMVEYDFQGRGAAVIPLLDKYGFVSNTLPYTYVEEIVGIPSEEVMKFVEVSVETDSDKIHKATRSHFYRGLPEENKVVYNVDKNFSWYRYSRISGEELLEYSKPVEGCKTMKKVLTYDKENLLKKEFKIGDLVTSLKSTYLINASRYANWNRKYLAHNSYSDTLTYVTIIKGSEGGFNGGK